MLWFKPKKPNPEKVSAAIKETVGLADALIYTDDELEETIIVSLKSGYFKACSVFDEYINNPDNRAVSRPYVENEIRTQHPNDRAFWSLALNPFLKEI